MRAHEFQVGQMVRIVPHLMPRSTRNAAIAPGSDLFEIIRLMPQTGSLFQYRIRNSATGQERLVTETEIREPSA